MKQILLIEDDEQDQFFMQRACQRSGPPPSLNCVSDGEAAVAYSTQTSPFAEGPIQPRPDLIFLDVKLPKRDGPDVLAWIHSRHEFSSWPVIMLTNSKCPADVLRAYELGATSYLCKLAGANEWEQAIKTTLHYWLHLNIPLL